MSIALNENVTATHWTVEDVLQGLEQIKVQKSQVIFADRGINGQALFELTPDDLTSMNVPEEDTKIILKELEILRATTKAVPIDVNVQMVSEVLNNKDDTLSIASTLSKKRPPPPPPKPGTASPSNASPSTSRKVSMAVPAKSTPPVPANGTASPMLIVTPADDNPTAVVCHNCGAEQKSFNQRCKECGRSLDSAKENQALPSHSVPPPLSRVSGDTNSLASFSTMDKGKSILRRSKEASMLRRGMHVRFDEASIASTHLEAKGIRGAQAGCARIRAATDARRRHAGSDVVPETGADRDRNRESSLRDIRKGARCHRALRGAGAARHSQADNRCRGRARVCFASLWRLYDANI